MSTKPEPYFDLSRMLYRQIRYPDVAALGRRKTLTVGDFAKAFAAANRGLSADMLRVRTTRNGWLEEVWLCMDKALDYTRCPRSRERRANAARLRITAGPPIGNLVAPKALGRKSGPILNVDPNAQP